MPDTAGSKQLGVWLGVATSAIVILHWFGVNDWHEFEAWLKKDNGRPQVTASALPASSLPTPMPTYSLPTPTPVDPGSTEGFQALRSFNASQKGTPNTLTLEQAYALAVEYRGFANNLRRAAADAEHRHVRSAINAAVADAHTAADDLDAYDIDSFNREIDQYHADIDSLLSACE